MADELRQARARRLSAERNLSPTAIHVSEDSSTARLVVEMHGAEARLDLVRKSREDDADVAGGHVVNAVSARAVNGKLDLGWQTGLRGA